MEEVKRVSNVLRMTAVAGALGLSLVVASCGGDDGSSNGAKGDGGKSTLTVGLAAPTNQAAISDPYSVSGAKAAINALNKRGGLAGHQLKLSYCNDQVDPNQTVVCANEFVKDKAIAVAGGDVTNDALYVPVLEKAGVPLVGFNPYTQYTQKNLYLFNGGPRFGYATLAAYAAKNNIPTAMVVSGTPAGQRTAQALTDAMKQAGGAFTSTVLVPATQPDYAPIAASALAKGAKAVLVVLGQSQQDQFINAAFSKDPSVQYFVGYEIGPRDKKAMSSVDLTKITYAAPFPPVTPDNELLTRFAKEMEAQKATGDADADEALHNFHGVGAWLAIQVLEKVVKDNNITDVNAQTISKALDASKAMDLGGVIPPWTPTAPGSKDFPRVSNATNYLIRYDQSGNGQLVTQQPITLEDALAGKF
jgi:ABC-type branched-subunit amino acid transport system substrate-binding protein